MTRRPNGKSAPHRDFSAIAQTELAAIHGVDVRTIRRWDEAGHPRRDDGTYSAPDSIAWRIEREAGTGDLDLNEQRARLAAAQSEKIERENAIAAGEILLRQHVVDVWGVLLSNFKSALLALPSRVAPLVEESVRGRVADLIDARVREILTELADSNPLAADPPEP